MAKSDQNLNAVFQDTANAIRAKKQSTNKITPRDFADEVASIQTGIEPTGTYEITSNGYYDIKNYAGVRARVYNYAIYNDNKRATQVTFQDSFSDVTYKVTRENTYYNFNSSFPGISIVTSIDATTLDQSGSNVLNFLDEVYSVDGNVITIVVAMATDPYLENYIDGINLTFTEVPWADDTDAVQNFIDWFVNNYTFEAYDILGRPLSTSSANINVWVSGDAS